MDDLLPIVYLCTGERRGEGCAIQLRHEYVCMLAEAGVPEEVAVQVVGHANAKMIHEVYMHLKSRMISGIGKKLDSVLGPALKVTG